MDAVVPLPETLRSHWIWQTAVPDGHGGDGGGEGAVGGLGGAVGVGGSAGGLKVLEQQRHQPS